MTNRREEVVYSRLRLGHTGLNDTLQIIGKSNGLCTRCQTKEDVEHVLFRCNKYHEFRQKWQEMEEENKIEDILREQGMERNRLKALFMFLENTGLIRRI